MIGNRQLIILVISRLNVARDLLKLLDFQRIDIINGASTISFTNITIRDKNPIQQAKGLSQTDSRALLDWENFSKWDTDGNPAARFVFNGTKDDINNFRRKFQENLMSLHKKSQAWRAKLQSCLEPSKFSQVMYGENNIQATDLIANVLAVVEKEKKTKN